MSKLLYLLIGLGVSFCSLSTAVEMSVRIELNPLTANAEIHYLVPPEAPDKIIVQAAFRSFAEDFKPAAINKYRSKMALARLTKADDTTLIDEQKQGQVVEFLAAGRERTLVWKTFPQLPVAEIAKGELKVVIKTADQEETVLAESSIPFKFDFRKVKVLNKFAGNPEIFPPIVAEQRGNEPGWYETSNGLDCVEKVDHLEPLAWRHGLQGKYAINLYVPISGYSMISLRLSSDYYSQRFPGVDGMEYLWKVADLSDTHLIIQDFYAFLSRIGDHARARLGYLKLVPVSDQDYDEWHSPWNTPKDKIVAAFFEPYSWAFSEYVRENSKFAEPMAAYQEAGVDIVDTQVGRCGMKFLFPSDLGMPLIGSTRGDAHVGKDGKVALGTVSLGTGRMVRLCDSIKASLKFAQAENIKCFINFGAGPSYESGNPLRSQFSDENPQFALDTNKSFLSYKYPEVQDYYLKHFHVALKAGAKHLTVNFKTYPHGIENSDQSLSILRKLRLLANQFSTPEERIKIMVLFPIPGSKGITIDNKFRPADWLDEKLVDYLVPATLADSDIYYFDPTPYVKMVKGSGVKLLVEFSASACCPIFPYEPLKLADRIYDAGCDGVYIYQADARIVGSMTAAQQEERRWFRILGSSQAVKQQLLEMEAKQTSYSVEMYTNFTYYFQSYRAQIWIEGIMPDTMLLTLSKVGESENLLTSQRNAWPWVLGEGGADNHYPVGDDFVIRAKAHDPISDRFFEKEFFIPRINRSISF